ncbi:uncharacterized mitochondrial protein-like protein [Tanacetum coccineum]
MAMASEQSSLEPTLHEMTLATPMFDEFFSPPASIASLVPVEEALAPVKSTGSPSSTSTSQTTSQSQSQTIPLFAEEESHNLEFAYMSNDPYFGIPILETISKETLSSDVISTTVHSDAPISEHLSTIDPTLFINRKGKDILLVQIYVDDIIFTSTTTTTEICDKFFEIMCSKFNMSMIGKISFFLGLQISQSLRGIFLNLSKYALESLEKYEMESCNPVDTPMVEKSKLDEGTQGKAVDPTHYRGMYQARPTKKHLHAIKRIFRYLKGTVNQRLWYLKDSAIALTAFVDVDYAGC